jgi:pimeloyl-ACP methyl ester carboxylesterase
VHGEEDRLVPLANGVQLSHRIPGARLLALPEAAHMYPTDAPEADREVVRFLAGEPASRPRAKAPRSGRAAAA